MYIFISHSSDDAATAENICSYLEQNGHGCFYAPRDIGSGHEYAEEIVNGIDRSAVMLLLLSEKANSSPHVLREVERAVSKKIPIIVYKLENVTLSKSMEYFLMTHQWLNAKQEKGYEDILKCIDSFSQHDDGTAVPPPAPAAYKVKNEQKNSMRNKYIVAAVLIVLCITGMILILVNRPQPPVSDSESTPTASTTPYSAELLPAESSTEPVATTSAPAETTTTATTTEATTTATTTEATTTVTTTMPTTAEPVEIPTAPVVELGDTITFGRYNDEAIEWRVISLSEDGTQAVVISDKILTMKCFDAAEGGKYNDINGESYWSTPPAELDSETLIQIRGDNRWENSNIRTWLNSDRENVVYSDQAPTLSAMSEHKNGYDTEAGFLSNFTDEELDAIVVTHNVTNGCATEDKVYLLLKEQMDWLIEADVSKYAKPTSAAVQQDKSAWYQLNVNEYGISEHYWWLRDASEEDASAAYIVTTSLTGGKINTDNVGLEGFGIRPAMTIDLTKLDNDPCGGRS